MNRLDSVRLLAAFQVLSMPSGALGATHKQARAVVVELTGEAPKRAGIPAPGADLLTYLEWHQPGPKRWNLED